jgi:hypothetical protein
MTMADARITLRKSFFEEKEREFLAVDGLTVSLFRYETGIEAVRLANRRGHLVVLPYLGQMVWDAVFDGVDLTMKNMFSAPRPVEGIIGTYGCFAFHSGILRNGCPSPEDDHPLHGEMPCAPMDAAALELGSDDRGPFVRLTGEREYVMGFGAHYVARPSVTMRLGETLFDIGLAVENLSAQPMDLMYMCHANFAFCEGGRFLQPAGFTPDSMVVRTAVPGHVVPTPAYDALVKELARDPSVMARLDEPHRYDPEQVFYIRNLRADGEGKTHLMLVRPAGDAFAMSYDLEQLPHTARWVLYNPDQQVCAFALPSTCEPEGYLAERHKGHVRSLPGRGRTMFTVRLGYLDAAEAGRAAAVIAGL